MYAAADNAKCPVDHENMSKEEAAEMMDKYKKMGHAAFMAKHVDVKENVEVKQEKNEPTDGCPVDHKNMSQEQIDAYMKSHKKVKSQAPAVNKEIVYDVYGQQLDKKNMMPAVPNQLPSPGQKKPLSTDREKSTIPKAGADEQETWTYPSEQMFYNALKRKGKADGVQEEDMQTVVAVHNTMNEKTWKQVMDWENKYHCQECDNPKLKSFMGKPHDLSPAARFRTWFRGYPMPFDRHDWTIDRCGKSEARYIIDYYYRDGPDPIEIHVRPAITSLSDAFDRLRHGAEHLRASILDTPSEQPASSVPTSLSAIASRRSQQVVSQDELGQEEFAFLSSLTPQGIQEIATDVQTKCANLDQVLRDAGDDPTALEKANMSVNYCMAQRICKPQANAFMEALENKGDEAAAYGKMTACLDRFHIVARRALLEAAGVKQSGPEFPVGAAPSVASRVEQR